MERFKWKIGCVFAFLMGFTVSPSAVWAQSNILNQYITSGLRDNLVLNQKNITLDKALLGLKIARNVYGPSVDFQATYSTAAGGRNIPLPIGDLLNGVYTTLNQITGNDLFPTVENVTINFLPHNYYDAKVRTTVPIFNKDIGYNVKINQQQVALQEQDIDTYRRELVKNIKTAYFNYLSTIQTVQVYESAVALAKEGLRVNQKLVESGKGLPAYVLRAKSEVAQTEAMLVQAKRQVENARLYFNALLNRPPDAAILTLYDTDQAVDEAIQSLSKRAVPEEREELKALREGMDMNEIVWKMRKDYFMPQLSGFLDVGSQAENFQFNRDSRYYMVGLQLNIPIFASNRNRLKMQEAAWDLRASKLRYQEVYQQLSMTSEMARNNLRSAYDQYQASLVQLSAAQDYQRLIDRGYKAGANSYIETVDARNQLMSAQIAMHINRYQMLIAAAEWEREAALYTFNTTSDEQK